MLTLGCKIQITNKDTQKKTIFSYVSNVSISTSIETLTDTATIVLPGNLKNIQDLIKEGDRVLIYLWYAQVPDYTPLFVGYVRNIVRNMTITLECEDEMWAFKKIKVPAKRYPKFDLKNFLTEFIPGLKVWVPKEVSFGEVIITKETTVAKVLDYLGQNYPLKAFFNDRSFVGVMLTSSLFAASKKEIVLKIGSNVISETLKYMREKDVNIIIKAKSILADNTKIEVQSPKDAKDGEIRTLYNSSFKTKETLQKYADEELQKWKVDKMTGELVCFGIPRVKKGDRILIKNDRDSEQNNKKFIVTSVKYTFGTGGFRQIVKLGDEIRGNNE